MMESRYRSRSIFDTRARTTAGQRAGMGPETAASAASSEGWADDLLLKVTPPRVQRHLVTRQRLSSTGDGLRDLPLVIVQAPAGFGKTSLLAQWRREHLARGTVVAWILAQAQDHPARLVQALALAVRTSAARPGFGHTLLNARPPDGLEGFTAWLAEVAQAAIDIVLFVDEAERLPPESVEALAYVLRNAPPNLRAVVAARTDCHLGIDDLVAYGQCAVVTQSMLRFQFDETLEVVRKRSNDRIDHDAAARLHDLTEGWPLGVQLALSAADSGREGRVALAESLARPDPLREHFVALLLANLCAADLGFLMRISILEQLHPDLCSALLPADDAAERLARLVRDTPVFVAAEGSDWVRMHSLARDVLRQRFVTLPATEQTALHARATEWLTSRGLLESAAHHALISGQSDCAFAFAERSLYDSLMTRGHNDSVLEWLARLPPGELDRRPRLLLAAAWSLALSERHGEAENMVVRLLAQPGVDDALKCECALILSGAAVFADNLDRFAELHDPWATAPPLHDPVLFKVHANRSAYRTLIDGEPALARLRQQRAPRSEVNPALGYVSRWGDLIVGLSFLWEGQMQLAEKQLRPALALAEDHLGRRAPFAVMLAALLATAVWEQGQPAEAATLLANRLDVLERTGLPEAVLHGCLTQARVAVAEGAEHRALELLGALHAVGVARRLPRLCVASLTEQVRLHARRFRAETCADLCAQIDALMADAASPQGPIWRRSTELLRDVARGHAAIAAQDWRRALEPLARADAVAQQIKAGRLHIELLGLRAFALDRCGEKSTGLLREAADLAQTYGLEGVFDQAHPGLGDWGRQTLHDPRGADTGLAGPLAAPMRAPQPQPDARARPSPSMALTPKECEVLTLLTRNLSNKEIGLAMQVGEATIKWHMKNLFAKLDAGTRKQVVQRAHIHGLLDAG